jgi:hypothetical protein
VTDWLTTLATTAPPADPAQQQAIGRGFLLIVVLIIVGILAVLGLLLAGFAWFAKNSMTEPERKDPYKGVDAWAESARRAEPDYPDGVPEGDDEDWEADG